MLFNRVGTIFDINIKCRQIELKTKKVFLNIKMVFSGFGDFL